MGMSHPVSAKKLRAAVRDSIQKADYHAGAINRQAGALVNLHRRVELVEAVAQGGFFARLRWLLRGVSAEKPAPKAVD